MSFEDSAAFATNELRIEQLLEQLEPLLENRRQALAANPRFQSFLGRAVKIGEKKTGPAALAPRTPADPDKAKLKRKQENARKKAVKKKKRAQKRGRVDSMIVDPRDERTAPPKKLQKLLEKPETTTTSSQPETDLDPNQFTFEKN
jgi:hypothetical protein